MSLQKFKPETVGETRITITDGQFKGYTVVVRTAVSNVIFEDKFKGKDNKIPIFRVIRHDSSVVIPPQADVRKPTK